MHSDVGVHRLLLPAYYVLITGMFLAKVQISELHDPHPDKFVGQNFDLPAVSIINYTMVFVGVASTVVALRRGGQQRPDSHTLAVEVLPALLPAIALVVMSLANKNYPQALVDGFVYMGMIALVQSPILYMYRNLMKMVLFEHLVHIILIFLTGCVLRYNVEPTASQVSRNGNPKLALTLDLIQWTFCGMVIVLQAIIFTAESVLCFEVLHMIMAKILSPQDVTLIEADDMNVVLSEWVVTNRRSSPGHTGRQWDTASVNSRGRVGGVDNDISHCDDYHLQGNGSESEDAGFTTGSDSDDGSNPGSLGIAGDNPSGSYDACSGRSVVYQASALPVVRRPGVTPSQRPPLGSSRRSVSGAWSGHGECPSRGIVLRGADSDNRCESFHVESVAAG